MDFGQSLMDEVMNALGMMTANADSLDLPTSVSSPSQPTVPVVEPALPVNSAKIISLENNSSSNHQPNGEDEDDGDEDSDDNTPTETGSESGSETETEAENNTEPAVEDPVAIEAVSSTPPPLPAQPPSRPLYHSSSSQNSEKSAVFVAPSSSSSSLTRPSANANIRAPRIPVTGRITTAQSQAANDNDEEIVNPLRRLRQNPLMFSR